MASNVYRSGIFHSLSILYSWKLIAAQDDSPLYRRGNKVLLGMAFVNIGIYISTKFYYIFRNKQRDRKWNALTPAQQLEYIETTSDKGNKRLDFRFAH